jgi:hypothetical protein
VSSGLVQQDRETCATMREAMFTRSVPFNPPCAFNPYTTCPIPVKDSILPVKVLAGEKAYPIHVTIPEPTQ